MADYNLQRDIQRWRETVPTLGGWSIYVRLCSDCVTFYRRLLRQLVEGDSIQGPTLIRLTRTFETLVLWADTHGILHGELCWTLEHSRRVRRCYIKSMNSICTTLLERLSPLHPTIDMGGIASSLRRTIEEAADRLEESYQDDDSRSSTSAASWAMTQDNIDEIIRDLEADVECLRNLDPLLMLRSTRAHTAHAGTNTWIPYQAICDSIANMFPEAQEATVHRVGKAMWDSFLRCMRLRHSNEKSDTVDIVEVARTVFTLSSTPWTEQTKDSGLGSSIATGAENLAFYAQLDDDTIDIPPLPEQAQKGEPFDCIACGRQVRIRNASAWRYMPFVCPTKW